MCFLGSLGVIGLAEVGVAFYTYERVPLATTVLLFGCAGVQVVCCIAGLCGFHYLNRECTCCSLLILLVAASGLGYSAVASYFWLRDETPEHPEHLLLVFGITSVADFFLVGTLLFVSLLYCFRRKAFIANEKTAELGVDFSDYDQRMKDRKALQKERKKAAKSSRKGTIEYSAHDHL